MQTVQAGVYCRISQDREGAGLGVDRQLSDCNALASKLGWSVAETYIDNDLSAYSGKPRPGYRALLEALESGRITGVVVWHTDRLHRLPRELEEYVDLCERRRVVTQTVKAGELDLSTASGRAVARTLGAWARFEVEHKSDRTKRAQLQAAQAGRWLGGMPPLGWHMQADGSAVLDVPAANRLREAATSLLAGVSMGSIVRSWNESGFTSSRGNPWNYATMRQVLLRARNAGLITYDGAIVAQSNWPAIMEEDTWRALCALLADPSRRRSSSNRVRWLMAGVAICGRDDCGLPLRSAAAKSATNAGSIRRVYRCPGSGGGHVARSAVDVDNLVLLVMAERLSRPDAAELLLGQSPGADAQELVNESVTLRARLAEAAEAFADGAITAAQLASISTRVRDRLSRAEAELALARGVSAARPLLVAPDPREAWYGATLEVQRAVIRELVDVRVMPGRRGRRFDPELVTFEWHS